MERFSFSTVPFSIVDASASKMMVDTLLRSDRFISAAQLTMLLL